MELAGSLQASTAPGSESSALLIGTAGMLLGVLYFAAAGWSDDDPRRRRYYAIITAIPAIAALTYLVMSLGYGVTTVGVGEEARTVYWARYVDWLLTTPLLLAILALLADADRNTVAALIGLDVAMVVTGLAATLLDRGVAGMGPGTTRLIAWGIATGLLFAVLYLLFGAISERAGRRPVEAGRLFATLRNLTAVLWIAYPVVWLVGPPGLGIVGLVPETAAFTALDLLAKVGFGLVLVRSKSALDRAASTAVAG